MPLPTPNKNEKQGEFVSRCTSTVVKEGKDQKQAVAICYSQWQKSKAEEAAKSIASAMTGRCANCGSKLKNGKCDCPDGGQHSMDDGDGPDMENDQEDMMEQDAACKTKKKKMNG